MSGWDYEARSLEVDTFRAEQFALKVALRNNAVNTPLAHPDPSATRGQIELFSLVRHSYDYVENLLRQLPRKRQQEHFRHLYLKEFKRQQDKHSPTAERDANVFLRELLSVRLGKVFSRYAFDLSWLSLSTRERWEWTMAQREVLQCNEQESKGLSWAFSVERATLRNKEGLQFYLVAESRLKPMAADIASIFSEIQTDFFTSFAFGQDAKQANALCHQVYAQTGKLCEQIGFILPYFETFKQCLEKGKPVNEQAMLSALSKVVCDKWWFRTLRKAQKLMVEHIAIACGEVRKGVAPYISAQGFMEWTGQMARNYDFLRQSIIENIDDPEERVELFDMWLKSSSNPALRRVEMMTRLRGVEEWAEVKGYQALFLTLTAPSAFHAEHSNAGQNRKWNGSSPKQTQAYLNKVWQQLRALLAKRDIDFKGMRVAEPHHDGTPHWHLLVYVLEKDVEETVALFKQKALELDGDERGAAQHRCKVELCDKTKGSATAYIAKYISKNIDGFGLDKDGSTSDEAESLSLKDNAKRVRAWASRWGIRQFQFYGVGSISVWRELRRGVKSQFSNTTMADMWTVADMGEYACYLEQQGGGSRRAAKVGLHYESLPENRYFEVRQRIDGVKLTAGGDVFVKTRVKKWVIKHKSKAVEAVQTVSAESILNTGRSPAWTWTWTWTCVSNCNPSTGKGSETGTGENVRAFLSTHANEVYRLENALNRRGIPSRWITDHRKMRLILGKSIGISGNERLTFDGVELHFC